MHKNNLKTALRFWNANRVFVIINTIGLSIALAASFTILMFVINEFSYNSFNKNSRRIFRVLNYNAYPKTTSTRTPYILAPTLLEDFPQIEKAIRIKSINGFELKLKDDFISIDDALATDFEIFEIFTLPVIMGSLDRHLLEVQNSLVISRYLAEKLFPVENPVGKIIVGKVNKEEHDFIITAVFENIPVNSTLNAQCFISSKWTLEPINKLYGIRNADEGWTRDFWNTWILLSEGSDANSLEEQFRSFEVKYQGKNPHNNYSLQNLTDVYMKSDNVQNTGMSGNMRNIRLLTLIAILILLVASINYTILSTAVSAIRAKEIGIRKTFGADNKTIRNQMLSESVLFVILVLPIALAMAWIALPYAGNLFNKELYIIGANLLSYISLYIVLTIVIGISSGIYTSTYLSSLNVLDTLKRINFAGKRKTLIRSSLIVIQLVIFCSFMASMLIIRSQYQYALEKDTGHLKENILQIDLGRDFTGYSSYLNSIRTYPTVIMAAGVSEGIPMVGSGYDMYPHFEDNEVLILVEGLAVDYGFLETMGIRAVQGRLFSEEFGSDMEKSTILNETAVKELGIKDPVGKMLRGKTIIGIVNDFNLHSIHSDIPPLEIEMTNKYINKIVVHYKQGTLKDILPMLEAEWKNITANKPFISITIEDLFKEIYASEKSLTATITLSAIFTILIAMIGLFGLTLFVSTTRTKEIGIKKVLGASERSILYSLLYENLILVVIATLISIPVTLDFMSKWLNNYPYKINISWWIFLVAFITAATIVLSIVFFHSSKISRTNPIKALRYE